jgi:hypothetical protein
VLRFRRQLTANLPPERNLASAYRVSLVGAAQPPGDVMRNFHRWTIALSATVLVGLMSVASTNAHAENNIRVQPAKKATSPTAAGPQWLRDLREQIRRVNEYHDGCR